MGTKHYPARMDTFIGKPTIYNATCGYVSTDAREFCRPEKPEGATCEACRNYDRLKSAENWTSTLRQEEE